MSTLGVRLPIYRRNFQDAGSLEVCPCQQFRRVLGVFHVIRSGLTNKSFEMRVEHGRRKSERAHFREQPQMSVAGYNLSLNAIARRWRGIHSRDYSTVSARQILVLMMAIPSRATE